MSQYIETIRLRNGTLENLKYHQQRFERTRARELGQKRHPKLGSVIRVPDGLDQGLFKCRVIYGREVLRIEFEPHIRHEVRSLKMVVSDSVSYRFKYSDRTSLETLYSLRGPCDDIIIVRKGCVTDSFYANLAFWDGKDWFTPDTPLLPGTMRASLLERGELKECRITPGELEYFRKIRLINAMNNLREGPEILPEAVIY